MSSVFTINFHISSVNLFTIEDTMLTPRQIEILQLLANGYNYKEISAMLGITMHTIKNHMWNIGLRMNTTGQVQSIMYAAHIGLIDLELAQLSVKSIVDNARG